MLAEEVWGLVPQYRVGSGFQGMAGAGWPEAMDVDQILGIRQAPEGHAKHLVRRWCTDRRHMDGGGEEQPQTEEPPSAQLCLGETVVAPGVPRGKASDGSEVSGPPTMFLQPVLPRASGFWLLAQAGSVYTLVNTDFKKISQVFSPT